MKNAEVAKIYPAGDAAVEIRFGTEMDLATNLAVYRYNRLVSEAHIDGFIESVPSYGSLVIYYDPILVDWDSISEKLSQILRMEVNLIESTPRTIEIGVTYGGENGTDLPDVAKLHSITETEVVHLHCDRLYRVYMMGFTPGFAYLGELDKKIITPRLAKPRLAVPAGSIGIAGNQTGIYPIQSPGGWRIIGRTKTCLFNPLVKDPFFLKPGDLVRFIPMPDGIL